MLPKTESLGTALTGKWDNTLFTASDVNAYQDANNILTFTDSRGTKGNFVQDVDGNVLLDLCGTESLPLGHNHNALIKHVNNWKWDHYVVNAGLDAGNHASDGFSQRASTLFNALRPNPRLEGVRLTTGRSATEMAMLDAFSQREGKRLAVGFAGSKHGQGLAMTQFAHP